MSKKYELGSPVWAEWGGEVYAGTVVGFVRDTMSLLRKSIIIELTQPRYGKDMMVRNRSHVAPRLPGKINP